MKTKEKITESQTHAINNYPGAAINVADNEKVTSRMVKQRVRVQNNNPRNND